MLLFLEISRSSTFRCFFLILLGLAVIPTSNYAEEEAEEEQQAVESSFLCSSEIFYTWRRNPAVTEPTLAEATQANEPPPEEDPIEVFFSRHEARATSEEQAKKTLQARESLKKKKALEECERKHQSMHICIATKLRGLGQDYNSFDYKVRSTLLDSVTTDCRSLQGRCLSSRASAIQCESLVNEEQQKPEVSGEEDKDDAKSKKRR